MTEIDILIAARKIADENEIEWRDLDELLPQQQLAQIRDRLSRQLLILRMEEQGLVEKILTQQAA